MILPDPYREELCARFRSDIEETKLRHILALMGMNMPADDPPDFDEIASWPELTGTNQHRGVIPFSIEVEAFGRKRKLHLRYAYVCELEPLAQDQQDSASDLDEPTFELRNEVAWLESMHWVSYLRDPEWQKVPIGILDPDMAEELHERAEAETAAALGFDNRSMT